jgi:hypothetical protein
MTPAMSGPKMGAYFAGKGSSMLEKCRSGPDIPHLHSPAISAAYIPHLICCNIATPAFGAGETALLYQSTHDGRM